MRKMTFEKLFSPISVGGVVIKNRIVSTGHDTTLPTDGRVNDALVAYQASRARGGAGLIILQVSGVHETARYTSHVLMANTDDCLEGYRKVAVAVHEFGAKIFGQLFHPGKEIMEAGDGLLPVAYAPSAVPTDRYRVIPRALSQTMIEEIIEGYGESARRMHAAGFDGVEVVASHGYLPSQFLNPLANLRTDAYGGDDERRRHFLHRVIETIRAKTPDGFVVGLRISIGEMHEDGLTADAALDAVCALELRLDYVNVTVGSSSAHSAAMHIAPPMMFASGYVKPKSADLKKRISIPVLLTGRINQPQDAEAILVAGEADLCGMTRAMITDPEMPNKAMAGDLDDIRACIGCNQSCIGRFQRGLPISCIQNPVSGRELQYGSKPKPASPKRVAIVGGGLAGMKAAVTARQRGHDVTLYERGITLGGQAVLAQLLPGRAEFGGSITNLLREIEVLKVRVQLNTPVDSSMITELAPDVVVIATGSTPYRPPFEVMGELQVAQAVDVLTGSAKVGNSVVVVDWRSDWVGTGIAIKLAQEGCRVRLAVNGAGPGEAIQSYTRDYNIGQLHSLGVEIIPFARLYGVDTSIVYLQHSVSLEAIILEDVDTLVLSSGNMSVDKIAADLEGYEGAVFQVGDCLTPRTAEEAILEGFVAGMSI